jgi:hypothetical protein
VKIELSFKSVFPDLTDAELSNFFLLQDEFDGGELQKV